VELPIPSPNDQIHPVGVLVDASVNCTIRGAVPDAGLAEKAATGATAATAVVVTVVGDVVATVVGTVVATVVAVVVAAVVAVTAVVAVAVGVTVPVGVAVAVGAVVTVVLSAAAGAMTMLRITIVRQKTKKKVSVFIPSASKDIPVSHCPVGFLPFVAL
jgi:hypothetical protein